MLTAQYLHEYVQRDAEAHAKVGQLLADETRSMFKTVVGGLIDMGPETAFGLLSQVVAETKEKNEDGKPVKGAKADAATSVRMSELRQIYGAVRSGMSFAIISKGREVAVMEARAWLKDNNITAKGEPVEQVQRRNAARKLAKAARSLLESDEGMEILSDDQVEKVEAGMPLALVLDEGQRKLIADKARQSVEADAIKRKLETWYKRADSMVDDMLGDGLGEDMIDGILARMRTRFEAIAKGEPAPM